MTSKGRPFTWWEKAALVAGGLGWCWAAAQLLITIVFLKPDKGPPSPMPEADRAFEQVPHVDRDLLGPLFDRLSHHRTCGVQWFADEVVVDRGIGPMNGATVPAWLAFTVGSRVFVGRLTIDIWEGLGLGTGGLESSVLFTDGANLRLVERVPPPNPGPLGWRVIRPGQCVLESTKPQDSSGVIGKFLIDLPSGKAVRVGGGVGDGGWIPLEDTLSFHGKNLVRVQEEGIRNDRYVTEHDGRYELTFRRMDHPDAGDVGGKAHDYAFGVSWGHGIHDFCSAPDEYGNCHSEVDE